MLVKLDTDAVASKMAELCSGLLEQEGYKAMRDMIDAFAANEDAVAQYERFMEQHLALQQKEELGQELSPEEATAYEQAELALYENDVIRQFMYAQREFSNLHQMVSKYFTMTVELDRVPEMSELKKAGCGCGGSCGAGH